MSYILPSNKFEILISPIIELNSNDSSDNIIKPTFTYEWFLYEKLKNNYKSFFNHKNGDSYEEFNFEEQLNYLYKKTMDNDNITTDNYNNSMFYEMNEFIIKYDIFKNNMFKKNNVFIISKYTDEILDAMKQNNVEYENYFTFSSFDDNFSANINPNKHIFDFMVFDILLEDNYIHKNFVTSKSSKIQKSIGKTKIVAVSKIEGLINFLFT